MEEIPVIPGGAVSRMRNIVEALAVLAHAISMVYSAGLRGAELLIKNRCPSGRASLRCGGRGSSAFTTLTSTPWRSSACRFTSG